MAKLSDAARLARLLDILEYLGAGHQVTVGQLSQRFGGSPRSLYEDLVAAWLAEDPRNVGIFPFQLCVEYSDDADPDRRPLCQRRVWVQPGPGGQPLAALLAGRSRRPEGSCARGSLQPPKSSE